MPKNKNNPAVFIPAKVEALTKRWEETTSRQKDVINRQQGIIENTRSILNDPNLTDSEKVQLAKEKIQ